MRKMLLLMCVCITAMQLFAQNRTVTGNVTDDKGSPLIGVTVAVPSTNLYTISKNGGDFSISVPSSATQLAFTYVGYATQTISIEGLSSVNVSLVISTAELGDVVVTGYSSVKRSEYAGATTRVSKDKINFVPNASFDQILQGRAPGLLVTAGSGQPGASARVQIRGASSISGGNSPLYVLDGVPIEDGVFQSLNPNDFANVEVLRDAVATAQYGNRGSSGVIVITTKRGSAGKPQLSYNFQYGTTEPGEQKFDMMNSAELLRFQEILGEQLNNDLPGWVYSKLNPDYANMSPAEQANADRILDSLKGINTNWQDVFMRTGTFQSHDINFAGGNESTRFFLGCGYYKEKGIGFRSDLKRYTFRANLDHNSERVTLSLSSLVGYTERDFIESEGAINLGNGFAAAYLGLPYQKLYNSDGNLATGPDAFGINNTGANAYDRLVSSSNGNNQLKSTVNISANYYITKNKMFYIGGFAGLDYRQTVRERSIYPNTYFALNQGFPTTTGTYNNSYDNHFEYIIRAIGGFRKTFADVHDVDLQLVSEYTRDHTKNFGYTGYGINEKLLNTPAGVTQGSLDNQLIAATTGFKSERALYAAMLLAKYSYKGKYILNASFRRDASSQLAPGFRYVNFIAGGITWNILKENFAANWNKVNDLRLRLSYGSSANADGFVFGDFGYLPTYGNGSFGENQTIVPSSPGSPQITWEKIKTLNVGLDFGFFKNRIRGTVDVYDKRSTDVIVSQRLSLTSGFRTQDINAGEVSNKGAELALNIDLLRTKDFIWSVGGNVAYNKNKVEALKQVSEFEQGTEIVRVGLPLGSHYIVKWGGVDAATGAPLYYTKDGKLTTNYSDDDRVAEFGTYDAPWIGGFNTTISYKGISLEAFFTFQQGFSRFNNQDFFQLNHAFATQGFNMRREMLTMWQKPGDVTNIQSPLYQRQFVSKDIQDASYVRFRNLRLGYNLDEKAISFLKILSGASFYVQAQNLYTWTNWVGFDPEDDNNIASYEYPTPRTLTFGVNVTFK